ncbi:fatty acid desaturase family protein [Sphingomonas baiyangensis]|uniref:Fatty acid desaturase n=1 Tax=Sphingomonas baiyangensis TaxID=2572576 RepID=A0A4U1L633_9SPHN|nr:fatty acid desaturase [Sphingomonas baiyangensis]TKD51730.1 fatty acid desaturase [Sphingomonas baiyangensis]
MFERPIVAADAPPFTPAAFRQRMFAETGGDYAQYRRLLTPRYGRAWLDIALGYAALCGWLVLVAQAGGLVAGLAAASIGAIGVGFLVAYLQLFIHEAAHFNLAASKRVNDRIADWAICWQIGTTIAAYRATHGEHHRHLGRERDTEISYRHALTRRFVIEMLTGVHALRVFLSRRGEARSTAGGSRVPLLRGIAIHAVLLVAMLALGAWPAALAWVGGIAVAFPFFATVRQLLEHRALPGMADEGDAVTRLFDDGVFARIFGGAGFNRHLLHHLEPQISYTRLADLEAFIMQTTMRADLAARRTTYARTFAELLREGAR